MNQRQLFHLVLDNLDRENGPPYYVNLDTAQLDYYDSRDGAFYDQKLRIKTYHHSILRYVTNLFNDKPVPQEGLICVVAFLLSSLRETKLLSLTPEEFLDVQHTLENLMAALSREEKLRLHQWIQRKKDEINQLNGDVDHHQT